RCCSGCSAARSGCRLAPCTPRATRPIRPWSRLSNSTIRLVSRQGRACRTKAGWASTRTASVRVAEPPQRRLVVRPALAHPAPGLEEDLAPEQRLHGLARGDGDGLDAFAALADDDGLLAFALHPDHRGDAQQLAVLLEALDLDRRRVRQLLA